MMVVGKLETVCGATKKSARKGGGGVSAGEVK